MNMNISDLIELNQLAIKQVSQYPKKRFLFEKIITDQGNHITGISGPRGAGKTVLLKQIAEQNPNAFYMSLDTSEDIDLFKIVKKLTENYNFQLILLDEIQYVKFYDRELKKIFDSLGTKIIFTSSSALAVHDSIFDLSRRVRIINLYPFSLREYIYFKETVKLPRLTIDDIKKKRWNSEHYRYGYMFEDYLQGGLLPFSLEEPDIFPLLENIIQKVIRSDIPAIADLRVTDLDNISKTLRFIGSSNVDGINYSSIARNVGITKYKAEMFVQLLKKAFLLNAIFPKGTNVQKQPKVLMHLPIRLLYKNYSEAIGGLREDYFAEMMKIAGFHFFYLKSTRGAKTPDYSVQYGSDEIIIEIGGKGKGRQQFKGIEKKKSLILSHSDNTEGITRPLFLLGYL